MRRRRRSQARQRKYVRNLSNIHDMPSEAKLGLLSRAVSKDYSPPLTIKLVQQYAAAVSGCRHLQLSIHRLPPEEKLAL